MFDENLSWYLNANIKYYLRMEETSVKKDDSFEESNRMHGMAWCCCACSGNEPTKHWAVFSESLSWEAAVAVLYWPEVKRGQRQRVGHGTRSTAVSGSVSWAYSEVNLQASYTSTGRSALSKPGHKMNLLADTYLQRVNCFLLCSHQWTYVW